MTVADDFFTDDVSDFQPVKNSDIMPCCNVTYFSEILPTDVAVGMLVLLTVVLLSCVN